MWNIQLKAAALNVWLDGMEQKLTTAGDMLDVLEMETEQLNAVWESMAGELWKAEFRERISGLKDDISELKRIVLNVVETEKVLADMENNMLVEANKL